MESTSTRSLRIPKLPDNPYVGLRPFNESENLLFFGRREQAIELLQRLHTHRFIAVVGSSGCGKSSLVRAGLIPKLKAGLLVEDRDQWRIATLKPGDGPLANLTAALFGEQDGVTQTATALALREAGLQALLQRLAPVLADANLLLLVDQFEEVFEFAQTGRDNPDPARREEAEEFVALLLALAAQSELPVYVVLTMRSDFIGDCDNFYGLPEALNRGQYLVPRLTRAQRQQAIEGPAQLFGATITPRLLDRVLNDLGEKDDQLPVLQHALLRTWEEWQRSGAAEIDLPHYEAERVGTIKHALDRDAERALEGLSESDLDIVRRMFQALTGTDMRRRRVRRRAYLSELCAVTGASQAQLDTLIRRFETESRSFLIRIPGHTPDDPLIDISHESLIRQWSKLANWMQREAQSRDVYLDLVKDARQYGEKRASLWRGAKLRVAREWQHLEHPSRAWAARYDADFDAAADFLNRSVKAERFWFLAACLVAATVVIAVLAALDWQRRQELAHQQKELEKGRTELARDIVEQGKTLTEWKPEEAIKQYDKALEVKNDNPQSYLWRGQAYVYNGEPGKARADLERVLTLNANAAQRQKAGDLLQKLDAAPVQAVQYSATERKQLIVQMYADDSDTRITATTKLLTAWKDDPGLIPALIAYARSQPDNSNGIVNSLVVMQALPPASLREQRAELSAWLTEVENMGPRTKWRTDQVRRSLADTPPRTIPSPRGIETPSPLPPK